MKGNVYTSQRCPICRGKLLHDENRGGCFCKDHPEIRATGNFTVHFGRKTAKRFQEYSFAIRFLTGCRFKEDEGTFDHRDYKASHPLGFKTQAEKWLSVKEQTTKHNTYRNIKRDMNNAIKHWGQANVKTLGYGEIEDYLFGIGGIGDKTRSNIKSVLHDFWGWLSKREGIQIPDFPETKFELGWRNIIDLETQSKILNEVWRISESTNQKIYMGIRWLATYVSIRPNEMRNLRERDINVNGFFVIPHPKEKKPKLVAMLPEDIELYESIQPKSLPDVYFFRHIKGNGACRPGDQFGKDYLWKWWTKACSNLGIKGVDLYGGTRHSTTTALSEHFTRDELRNSGTFHASNKAFERYCQSQKQDSLRIYQKVKEVRGEVVKMRKKSNG